MSTTLVPSSQGSVVVTNRNVVVTMSVPAEAVTDVVEVLNASDLSVLTQAVKVNQYWKAAFSIPLNLTVIDVTARVKRGSSSSILTTPTFRIIYQPAVTSTPSPTPTRIVTPTPTATITPTVTPTRTPTPTFTVTPTVTVTPTPTVTLTPTPLPTLTTTPTSTPTITPTVTVTSTPAVSIIQTPTPTPTPTSQGNLTFNQPPPSNSNVTFT